MELHVCDTLVEELSLFPVPIIIVMLIDSGVVGCQEQEPIFDSVHVHMTRKIFVHLHFPQQGLNNCSESVPVCGVESKHGLGLGLGLGYSQHMWVRSGYSQHMGVRSRYSHTRPWVRSGYSQHTGVRSGYSPHTWIRSGYSQHTWLRSPWSFSV